MDIAIYSRTAALNNESIENQIKTCREYAKNKFKDIGNIYVYADNGYSGQNTDRPEYQRMIRDLKEERFDVILCYRLECITRKLPDLDKFCEMMNDHGINFAIVK